MAEPVANSHESGTEIGEDGQQSVCRICLSHEGTGADDQLLRPCKCRGSQAWVHKSCLQKWQRKVQLAATSNHPNDVAREQRHLVCNVCREPFDLPPPSRSKLLSDLAGVETGTLRPGLLLVSARRESPGSLSAEGMPFLLQVLCEVKHQNFKNALYLLTEEMEQHVGRGNSVSDAILGVNLVRPMERDSENTLETLVGLDAEMRSHLRKNNVKLEIFNGGPVNPKTIIAMCIVSQWPPSLQSPSVHTLINEDLDPSSSVLCMGPVNEIVELAVREAHDTRLQPVHVSCFAGYAVWSKTQLLGEIARGSWRWRQGVISDVLPIPGQDNQGDWVPPHERFDACTLPETSRPLHAAAPNEMSREYERRFSRDRTAQPSTEDIQLRGAVASLVSEFETTRRRR